MIVRPLKDSSKRRSYGVVTSDKRSYTLNNNIPWTQIAIVHKFRTAVELHLDAQ